MGFNRIFGLALILSVVWHLSWSLFFDLSLEKKVLSPEKITPVYYVGRSLSSKGKIATEAGISSVLPPFTLPKIDLIQPPLPSKKLPEIEEEMLDKRAKEIAEYKTEMSLKKDLASNLDRKALPHWVLPEKSPKEKEYPIRWEGEIREIIHSYYPPYPEWVEEAGITASVILKLLVSKDGNVKEVRVEKSSGEAGLDLLAINYLRRWQFLPSNSESAGLITIEFRRKE